MTETKPKERPILFASHLVPKLLDGSKTVTRRPLIPQPHEDTTEFGAGWSAITNAPIYEPRTQESPAGNDWRSFGGDDALGRDIYGDPGKEYVYVQTGKIIACPFGRVGDRLWVRETWCKPEPGPLREGDEIAYRADYFNDPHGPDGARSPQGKYRTWRPSIHMPRWASRLTLEITDVSVERLQDITDEQCRLEGVCILDDANQPARRHRLYRTYFRESWDALYKSKGYGWEENPWVWAVRFRKLES